MRTRVTQILCTLFTLTMLAFPATNAFATQSDTPVDVRIWTVTEDGDPVYDICYTLVGFSNLGCDENGDGNVLFEAIPPGSYLVEASAPNGSNYTVEPFSILVDASHTDYTISAFAIATEAPTTVTTEPPATVGTTDLLLVTRDPKTGKALTDVCYELVGYSNIGCDENEDGRVEFADIPFSSVYTIRQTTTPAGYARMDDYSVSVMPTDMHGPLTILLAQAKTQAPTGKINVSVVFYDAASGAVVPGAENCARLWNGTTAASKTGCDEEIIDGQVDFMQVAFDPDADNSRLTAEPMCGYELSPGANFRLLWVGQQTAIIYVSLDATNANCP